MAKKSKKKSRTITPEERQVIAQYAVDHPDAKVTDIAAYWGCTPAQVRYAMQLVEDGEIAVRRDIISERLAAETALAGIDDPAAAIREEIDYALAQLRSKPEMPIGQRLKYIKDAVAAMKALKALTLADHMRAEDIGVLYTLIRRFVPGAGDEECIRIYEEAREGWKASRG